LSLAVGGACVLLWLITILRAYLDSELNFTEMRWRDWALFLLVATGCFAFGWCAVRVVAWVRRGFAKDQRENVRPSD
jgi:hypothetical protein